MALTGAHGEGEHLRRPAARRREVEPWGRQGSCPEREVLGRTFGKAPARCGEVERAFGDAADREQRRRSSRYAVEAAEVAARPHGNGIHLSSRHAARRRRRRVLHGAAAVRAPRARGSLRSSRGERPACGRNGGAAGRRGPRLHGAARDEGPRSGGGLCSEREELRRRLTVARRAGRGDRAPRSRAAVAAAAGQRRLRKKGRGGLSWLLR